MTFFCFFLFNLDRMLVFFNFCISSIFSFNLLQHYYKVFTYVVGLIFGTYELSYLEELKNEKKREIIAFFKWTSFFYGDVFYTFFFFDTTFLVNFLSSSIQSRYLSIFFIFFF